MDGASNMATFEEMHENVCEAILNKDSMRYDNGHRSLTPFFSNDLADKLHDLSGQVLVAYIQGNDEEMLKIMKKLCNDEIESIIDFLWG